MTSLRSDVFFYVTLPVTLTGLVRHCGGEGPILLKLLSGAGTSRLRCGISGDAVSRGELGTTSNNVKKEVNVQNKSFPVKRQVLGNVLNTVITYKT